ncbi:pyrroline-5-carboxylate reductase [Bacteroidia bacterium]|nr:pyrroline-5-carboxylate reductase [Bacteroidia bacterium]
MNIGIIGAGNMGGAIAQGLLSSKQIAPQQLLVADVNAAILAPLAAQGCCTLNNNSQLVQKADVVVLAVKPWLVPTVLQEIRSALSVDKILISVAAGVTLDNLQNECGIALPLFRIIPNTAIAVQQSMSFISSRNASQAQQKIVVKLFDSLGKTLLIAEEQMAAATALSSCGIAYAMRYVSANMRAGVEIGFAPTVAKSIILQTLQGAVSLLQLTDAHPEAEIDRVTTPKGYTIKGLNALEHKGFTSAVVEAVKASLSL